MSTEQLLAASSVHRNAGDAATAVDTAVLAYHDAADATGRGLAAVAVALGHLDLGLAADAIHWSDAALAQLPGHRGALACRGLAQRAVGRPDRALADLDAAVQVSLLGLRDDEATEVPRRARLGRALVLNDLGRRREGYAELALAVAGQQQPADDDMELRKIARRVRGEWRLADGDLPGAAADLAEAARLGDRRSLARLLEVAELPDDPAVLLTRLIALRVAEQGAEAAEIGKALLATPDLPPTVHAKTLINCGYLAMPAGGWPAVADWVAQAAAVAPDDADVATVCGRVLGMAGRGEEAVAMLLRAVELAPGDGHPEAHLGELYASAGQLDVAVEWYEQALEIVPCDPAVRFGLASVLASLGREAEAAATAVRAAVGGSAPAVEWCRAMEIPLPGDLAEAALNDLAATGDRPTAADRLIEAAELWLACSGGPGDTPARHAAGALVRAAGCLVALGALTAAEGAARRAVELRPVAVDAWLLLADLMAGCGRLAEALDGYDRALWCEPRALAVLSGRAEVLRRMGRAEEALGTLNVAVDLETDGQALLVRRARLLQSLGRWEAALADLDRLRADLLDPHDIAEWRRGIEALAALAAAGPDRHPPAEYRQYGMTREEWDADGGADLPLRLQFAEEPSADARVAVAGAVGPSLAADAAGCQVGMLWSGRFALLRVRTADPTAAGTVSWALHRAVAELHAVWPLVEVVNLAARGAAFSDDQAEAWSAAGHPVPDGGPDFGVPATFWAPAPVDESTFPAPAPDPQVDAVLAAAVVAGSPVADPFAGAPAGDPFVGAPPADAFAMDPLAGVFPVDPPAGAFPADPLAGAYPVDPLAGGFQMDPPVDPFAGELPVDPFPVGPPADPFAVGGPADALADPLTDPLPDLLGDPLVGPLPDARTDPLTDPLPELLPGGAGSGGDEVAGEPAEIMVVMIEPAAVPVAAGRDLAELRRYPGDLVRLAPDGAGVVLRRPDGTGTGLDRVTADGAVHEVVSVDDEQLDGLRPIEAVAVSPNGALAMFTTGAGRTLHLLDLASGGSAPLLEGVPKVESAEFLDDVQIMVKTVSWLAVFVLTPDGPVAVARDFASVGPATTCADGRLIITSGIREPELVIYGYAGGVLGRLAEVSAPVNCYRVWTVGDRAFAADRSTFEIVGMLPAWERFALWAAGLPDVDADGGVLVEELEDAPYTGINDGLEELGGQAEWCVKGPAGLLLATRAFGQRSEILVGDTAGVGLTSPPLRGAGFEYDWRPDGRALLVRDQETGTVFEVDVVRASAHEIATGAEQVCYTATGFAALRGDELVLYAWQHGSPDAPLELARHPVASGVSTLGWADGGRVLHLTAGGSTGLYVLGGGAMYPIGSFPAQEWFSGWNHEGDLFFANCHSGRNFRAYRVTGFGRGVVAALGSEPVDHLVPAELAPVRYVERSTYPGTTQWRYFQDA